MKFANKLFSIIEYTWKKVEPMFNSKTFSTKARKSALIITIFFEVVLIMSFTHLWLIFVFAVSAAGLFYAVDKLLSDWPESDDE